MSPILQLFSEVALDALGSPWAHASPRTIIWGFAFSCLPPLEVFVHRLLAVTAASSRGAVPFWSRGQFFYQRPTRLLHPQKPKIICRDALIFTLKPREGTSPFPPAALWVTSRLRCERRVV